jgi:hypothetical protein
MDELGKLVRSPFFNTNENVVKLFYHIKKFYPGLESRALRKELAFKKLYPGEKYNDSRMRLLMFKLNNLAEEYLRQQSARNNRSWQQIYLLESLKIKKLYKAYAKNLALAREVNYRDNINTEEYFFVQYTIEYINIGYEITRQLDVNEKVLGNSKLQESLKNLTCFTLLSTLKFYLFLSNISYRFKLDSDTSLLDELLNHFKKRSYEDVPIISLYYYLFMMRYEPQNIENFVKAKGVFFKHEEEFHMFDRLNVYVNLENYLWKEDRKGRKDFTRDLFELYNRRLEKGVYKLRGFMANQIYKRIVRTALRLENEKYALKFMKDYRKDLKPDFSEGVYNYCRALCCFYAREYGKALEHLAISQNEDISHKFDVKNLTMMIYFEAGEHEPLRLALDSYRHFLRNNKFISEQVKSRASLFFKYMSRLSKAAAGGDKEHAEKLRTEIESLEELENRYWFEEKVEELL